MKMIVRYAQWLQRLPSLLCRSDEFWCLPSIAKSNGKIDPNGKNSV